MSGGQNVHWRRKSKEGDTNISQGTWALQQTIGPSRHDEPTRYGLLLSERPLLVLRQRFLASKYKIGTSNIVPYHIMCVFFTLNRSFYPSHIPPLLCCAVLYHTGIKYQETTLRGATREVTYTPWDGFPIYSRYFFFNLFVFFFSFSFSACFFSGVHIYIIAWICSYASTI